MPLDSGEEISLEKSAGRRGKARPRLHEEAGGDAGQPVARVLQLVAALKAEQESLAPAASSEDPAARVKLIGSLRHILEAREQERQAWQAQIRQLETQLAEAQTSVERISQQHDRLVGDLKLMHDHQRSIWGLERRRLEITIAGFEQARKKTLLSRAARLARPALAAGLLAATVAAVALSADSAGIIGGARLHIDDTARATIVVLDGAPATTASP